MFNSQGYSHPDVLISFGFCLSLKFPQMESLHACGVWSVLEVW